MNVRRSLVSIPLACLALTACGSDERVELFVDLRTDFVPVHEFDIVEVTVTAQSRPYDLHQERTVVGEESFVRGQRVAEYAGLAKGTYRIVVRLRGRSGLLLAERPASVEIRNDRLVTIVVTRDCQGVLCEDPAASACLQGRCVPDTCTLETPEFCPEPGCQNVSDCDAPAAMCAEAVCEEGTCLVSARTPAVCTAGTYCDPAVGCLTSDVAMDAGPSDAGPLDAGPLDAGPMDAGSPDAGPPDAGPPDAGPMDAGSPDAGPPGTVVSATQVLGATGSERAFGMDVSPTGQASVTGRFSGMTTVLGAVLTSAGTDDAYLARVRPDGSSAGARSMGGTSFDLGTGVSVDDSTGDILVTGRFRNTVDFGGGARVAAGQLDAFLARYASDGTHLWSQAHGGTLDDVFHAVAVCPGGNVFAVGEFRGNASFGGAALTAIGCSDVVVSSYTSTGVHRWSNRFGSDGCDVARSVACDGSGGVLVTGAFESSVNFGGGTFTSAGATDIFLARYASDGTHLWSSEFGNLETDAGSAVAVDGSGNVVMAGHVTGDVDFGSGTPVPGGGAFVASFDALGVHRWSRPLGTAGGESAAAVTTDGAGNVYVTGELTRPTDFGSGLEPLYGSADIAIASYDMNGNPRWSNTFGGAGFDTGTAISFEPSTSLLYVAGHFNGTIDFGEGPVSSAGADDAFLLRLVP